MQIDVWLPRTSLPHAAPSRAALLEEVAVPVLSSALPAARRRPAAVPASPAAAPAAPVRPSERLASVVPLRPKVLESRKLPEPETKPAAPQARKEAPPRFALQLMQAGDCLLLVELPNGEIMQQRDPARRLLGDLLRAAGLPPAQALGEPLRWPLLRGVSSRSFDLGPQGARDYVSTLLQAQLERQPARAVWLLGDAARRFSGSEAQPPAGTFVWQLPGLDELIEQPGLKPGLWQDMQRVMPRWTVNHE